MEDMGSFRIGLIKFSFAIDFERKVTYVTTRVLNKRHGRIDRIVEVFDFVPSSLPELRSAVAKRFGLSSSS